MFRNDVSPLTVTGCGSQVSFADGDERYVRVTFVVDASTATPVGPVTLTPDMKLGSSPYASIAASLNGKSETDFLQVRNNSSALTQANLESAFSTANYPRLQSLLNGGQTLTNIGTPILPSDAVIKSYADGYLGGKTIDITGIAPSVGNGKVLTWDAVAAKWVASLPAAGITTLTGDVTANGSGSVVASITADAVTNSKIANGSISSSKIAPGYAINRIVMTDGTTGSTLTYSHCSNVNEVLKWTLTGWQCTNVSSLAPVTSVAGKTGVITLNINDVDGLGTAATRNVGTSNGNIIEVTAAGLPAVDGGQLTNVNATRLQSRTLASTSPSSGQVLTWNGSQWEPTTPPANGNDNLGNHTATQNILLNGNWLSGDGGSEGVFVAANGSVGVGTANPGAPVDLQAAPGGNPTLIVKNNSLGNWQAIAQFLSPGLSQGYQTFIQVGQNGSTSNSGTLSFNYNGNGSISNSMSLNLSGQSAALTINGSGNVGIGTVSPNARLEISSGSSGVSGLKFTNFNSSAATASGQPVGVDASGNLITVASPGTTFPLAGSAGSAAAPTYSFTGDTDTGWFSPGAGILAASNDGTERLRIDASGNVGIGTTTPVTFFDVVGSSGTNDPIARFGTGENTDNNAVSVRSGTAIISIATAGGTNAFVPGSTVGDGVIRVGAAKLVLGDGTLNRMTLDQFGKVGIGTTSPEDGIHVTRSYAFAASFVNTAALSSTSGAGVSAYVYNTPTAADQRLGYFALGSKGAGTNRYNPVTISGFSEGAWTAGSSHPSYLTIETTPSGSITKVERFRVTSSGNVGIGTASPSARFEVSSGTAGISGLKFTNFNSSAATASGQPVGVDASGNLITVASSGTTYPLAGSAGSAAAPTYSFTGDTDTGWFSPGAGILAASINSTERVRIDSTGYVGIGTATPGGLLHVYSNQNGAAQILLQNPNIGASASTGVRLSNDNGIVGWLLAGSTNYGGGDTPQNRLELQSSSNADGVNIRSNSSGARSGDIRFFTHFGTGESMRITLAGNVGIGTTVPATLIHAMATTPEFRMGQSTTDYITIKDTGSGVAQIQKTAASGASYLDLSSISSDGSSQASIRFFPNTNTSGERNIVILKGDGSNTINTQLDASGSGTTYIAALGGNVGVGTASPTAKLEVTSGSAGVSGLKFTNFNSSSATSTGQPIGVDASGNLVTVSGGGGITYPLTGSAGSASAPTYSFTGDTDTGWFSPGAGILAASNNGTERLRIDSAGYVGIGTTSPSRLLHVVGPMRVTASALPGTPGTGDIAVDSGDSNKLKWYDGSAWQAAGGSSGSSFAGAVNVSTTPYTITSSQNGKAFYYSNNANGVINLPALSGVSDGFSVTIQRQVAKTLTITPNGSDKFPGGVSTIEMLGKNLQSVTVMKLGTLWALNNQTEDCTVGQECWTADAVGGGTQGTMKQIYVGTYKGRQLFTTPGGCTSSATPTCAGGTDSVTKMWSSGATTTGTTAGNTATVLGALNESSFSDATVACSTCGSMGMAEYLGTAFTDTAAAKYCTDMTYAGYSDWYLPSKEELVFLYRNSANIGGFLYSSSGYYWASTEGAAGSGYTILFLNGSATTTLKNNSYNVRCVRRQ